MKLPRRYDLLDRVAKELFPVTESENSCAITRKEHEGIREKHIKAPIRRHLFCVDDGMVIRFR